MTDTAQTPTSFARLFKRQFAIWAAVSTVCTGMATAQTTKPSDPASNVDLSKGKTLYVVGYSHLDTQWRWAYPQVIRDYIPDTLHSNFKLIEKYPDYVFNFSGSRRYEMMKEYYPADYAKLKEYVAAGRWFPCGSSVDEGDSVVPNAESLVRHVLYGNEFFRREFGTASDEFMLPDCFGFPFSLPTILTHSGVKGFSTQKLTWGSAVGVPFKVGVWEGVDGSKITSALDPGAYTGVVREDLSRSNGWLARINNTGKQSNAFVDYHYYGTGDKGGAPDEMSVSWIERSLKGDGPIKVLSAKADAMFHSLTKEQTDKLPTYKGELLLTQHSAGSITSQAYMKRWNRKNEQLATAAERASVAATWLGNLPYPGQRIYKAWDLLLGSQMHDILPGTSLPKAYEYSWNDEAIVGNQFGHIATDAVEAVSAQLDTQGDGVPLVVYNPLSTEREDVVEASVVFSNAAPKNVRVTGPDGKAVPAQVIATDGNTATVLILAKVPSVGFATFHVQPAETAAAASGLKVSDTSVESDRFRVTINAAGDIASVFDKQNNKESLQSPARFVLTHENPRDYPAWNMDWEDRKNPPRAFVEGKPTVRVLENGPVRVALEVTREHEGSRYVQTIRLAAGGAGDTVQVANTIQWVGRESALKASFQLAASNPTAVYDSQVGVVERGNNDPKKYEVPQHLWFDLTDKNGTFGTAILNDSKYGSDKPDDNTMRLTLLYTPGTRAGYQDQGTQDVGQHDIVYSIAPHSGDWRQGNVPQQAARLNQPLRAFQTSAHAGSLGKSFSLVKVSNALVELTAVKKAENSDAIVVRLRELSGKPTRDVRVSFASPVTAAIEVDGQERQIASANVRDNALVTDLHGFDLKAFAVTLAPTPNKAAPAQSEPLTLAFDADVISTDSNPKDGAIDRDGRTLPAEQLPAELVAGGVSFKIGPTADGQKNAAVANGQSINIPAGSQRVYVLCTAVNGDTAADFTVGDTKSSVRVQDWTGYVGQWDNRLWEGNVPELAFGWTNKWGGLAPGFVKPAEVAWFASHRHHPAGGNEFYQYSYLYKHGFDVPAGATSVTLPKNENVRVLAVTAVKQASPDVVVATPLFDTLAGHQPTPPSITPATGTFDDSTEVTLHHGLYWQAGQLRYTLDGSEPTATSPAYTAKLLVGQKTTIKAAEFANGQRVGGTAEATLDVQDAKAPTVVSADLVAPNVPVAVTFSELVDAKTAENPASYTLSNNAKIASAKLAENGRTVLLTFDKPVASGPELTLTVHGVKDRSPAANTLASAALTLQTNSVIYTLDKAEAGKPVEAQVAGLPTKARDPWTMSFFVKPAKRIPNRTVIAGFGSMEQRDGQGRYVAKFGNGIHFWADKQDADTTTGFDVGKWQMITAAFDGTKLTLFKNAAVIGEATPELADDSDSTVRLFPADPWEKRQTFDGDIRGLMIWNKALSPAMVTALYEAGKKTAE